MTGRHLSQPKSRFFPCIIIDSSSSSSSPSSASGRFIWTTFTFLSPSLSSSSSSCSSTSLVRIHSGDRSSCYQHNATPDVPIIRIASHHRNLSASPSSFRTSRVDLRPCHPIYPSILAVLFSLLNLWFQLGGIPSVLLLLLLL